MLLACGKISLGSIDFYPVDFIQCALAIMVQFAKSGGHDLFLPPYLGCAQSFILFFKGAWTWAGQERNGTAVSRNEDSAGRAGGWTAAHRRCQTAPGGQHAGLESSVWERPAEQRWARGGETEAASQTGVCSPAWLLQSNVNPWDADVCWETGR